MPDNQGLSHLSDHFLIVAVVLYSLAVLVFAADFAFGRRSPVVKQAEAEMPDRVPAGVTAPPARPAGAAAGGTAEAAATGSGAGGSGAAGQGAPGQGAPGSQSRAPASHLVRLALTLTAAGLALHVAGVITRGLAVHRVPWGDMYEFVISVSCVAVLFFIGLMIKYRPYYLGLFFMAPIVIILGLAQTVIYTPAGPLVPALNSYWLAIHVTAMTLASGTFMVGAVLAVVYLFAERHTRRVAAGLSTR